MKLQVEFDAGLRCEAGQLLMRNGQEAAGVRWLQRALERDPSYVPARRALADYYQRAGYFAEFFKDMSAWAAAGKIKYREDVVQGLENAPQAFMGMLEGKNFGKLVVQIA